MGDGVQTLLWLGMPVLAWLLIARTRKVGVPVGAVLLLGAAAGVVVAATGALDRGGLEPALAYSVGAALLVTAAARSQEEKAAAAADSTVRDALRVGAISTVWCQAALAVLAALGVFLLGASTGSPSADEMPWLPDGFTAVGKDDASCGSGSCYRTRTYAVSPDLPADEAAGLARSSGCRPNGWILDRRERCVDYRLSGDKLVVTVSLADRIQ